MLRRANQVYGEQWGYISSSYAGARPPGFSSTFTSGSVIVPGNNIKGDYVATGTALEQDCYRIEVSFFGGNTNAQARDMLCDVGIDPAGGSNFLAQPPLIPNLLASCANPASTGWGFTYTFPLFIRAGSSLALRASVNNATVGLVRALVTVWGAPRDKSVLRVGSAVRDYGTFVSASSGTSVIPGQASEGAWYQLGSVAAGDRPWWWQCAAGMNNATMSALNYFQDFAIGSVNAKRIVIQDQKAGTNTSEVMWCESRILDCEYQASPGDILYGRSQCSGNPDAGYAMACWGVVG